MFNCPMSPHCLSVLVVQALLSPISEQKTICGSALDNHLHLSTTKFSDVNRNESREGATDICKIRVVLLVSVVSVICSHS